MTDAPTLDPQVKALLAQAAAQPQPPPETQSPEQIRQAYSALNPLAGPPEDVAHVEDRVITGPDGRLAVRLYHPRPGEMLPVVVFTHGGSFIAGDLDTHDAPLRALANRSNCLILAVDYRRPPEARFPAALEDAYAALLWASTQAGEVGGDARRLAVAGDSAGGNLAAALTLLARERGGPSIAFQLLLYPMLDATASSASYSSFAEGFLITRAGLLDGYARYLPEGTDRKDPRVSPYWAERLEGLPPAMIVTAGSDPLRDEGESYAARLAQAGTAVTSKRYPGMVHGFFQMAGQIDAGKLVIDDAASALRGALSVADDPAHRPTAADVST